MSKFLISDLRILFTLFLSLQIVATINAQCTLNIPSTDGYTVHVVLTPVNVVVSSTSCPFGYNYNLDIDHQISFSGSNIPASLFLLQGTIDCGGTGLFFPLPNGGGNATTTTTSNPFRSQTDCATATPESLACNGIDLEIAGPGISNMTINCIVNYSGAAALPVELIDFTSEIIDGNVAIKWETASELNNDYFELQRSTDGLNWKVLDVIPGMGTTHLPTRYKFLDENPISGSSFYRLKQVDEDGSFELSEVISLDFKFEKNIELFPNPTNDILNVRGLQTQYNARLFDTYGREFNTHFINSNQMDVSSLESGIYYLLVDNRMLRFVNN